MKARVCELCDGEADLYCLADSAFLCFNCDSTVHSANFLVARHIRRTVCSSCKSLTDYCVAGVKSPPRLPICRSCSHESTKIHLNSVSPSSSSCISSAESTVNSRKKEPKFNCSKREVLAGNAEAVLANWCRKLGLDSSFVSAVVMPVAMKAIGVCWSELTVLPFRVLLSASLWSSLRLIGNGSVSTWQALNMLEKFSGVPAKLIIAAESKLARRLRLRSKASDDQLEEGWAEC